MTVNKGSFTIDIIAGEIFFQWKQEGRGESMEEYGRLPLIGDVAPEFRAITTMGKINFPSDYKGKWVILFSHPADFTPVCTTEFMVLASMVEELEEINTVLVGLSIDSLSSHIAWLRTVEEMEWGPFSKEKVRFPLIADPSMKVAKLYGMLHPNTANTQTVRAVFIIDPESKIRTIMYYPMSTGRNFKEIKRTIVALQKADEHHISTPAEWEEGDDVIVPTPLDMDNAQCRIDGTDDSDYSLDWFMGFKKAEKVKK